MKNRKIYLLMGFILVLMIVLSACAKEETPTPRADAFATQPNTEEVTTAGGETAEPPPQDEDVPEDLPVPELAYNVKVARDGQFISYEIDGSIENIAGYLQEALLDYGWDIEVSPDSIVGAMATMMRNNEAGDLLSISMSYNNNGDFVTVQNNVIRE
jgi:hypothetical protein